MTFTREDLLGKRLMAIDYGERRTGIAVCDEMHIVVSSRPLILTSPSIVKDVLQLAISDRVEVIIVGMPLMHDERVTPIMETIRAFVMQLQELSSIPVYTADEAFSTSEARQIMIASGMKRKKRQTKGVKDQVAAAVILKRVLVEIGSATL